MSTSIDWAAQFLGVKVGSNVEEIRAAYLERAKEYHPDCSGCSCYRSSFN